MQWRGEKLDKKDFLGKSDPFLVFHRINDATRCLPCKATQRDNLPWLASTTVVHRTDYIRNTLNPVWLPIQIPLRTLCAGNRDRSTSLSEPQKGPGRREEWDLKRVPDRVLRL